jgi:leucyl-tRNA synthetase
VLQFFQHLIVNPKNQRQKMNYDFQKIEDRWQKYWEKNPYFKAKSDKTLKKFYCLDMFPYPSGAGLHVGHCKNYVLSDLYARIKFMQGYNVLHPMGWDAFGLPAENYAIQQKINPKICTKQNIAKFKQQINTLGPIYDWSKELNTTDPKYYKWTQWIFLQMYKKGLAYEANMPINWCPKCLTGIANEEVVAGECDRCGTKVTQKNIRQWVLKITEYAEQLLSGLDKLEWSEKVKLMQRNWIGKSEGAKITFKTENGIDLTVFTTRPDTIYGATFMVMAPDHDLASKITTPEHKKVVQEYQKKVETLTEMDRTDQTREKTGAFTGSYAINPINHVKLPIYLSDYVLKNYGTGIIMSVPAHDQRDFDFAKKFGLEIKQILNPINPTKNYFDDKKNLVCAIEEDGTLINSEQFNGYEARVDGAKHIVKYLEKEGLAKPEVQYKLRDWIFSRQRYWGEPIPIIHCTKCGVVPVPEDQLPVVLPDVENYQPTGTGESPLAAISDWVNTKCPKCGGPAKRETNTMPQWAGSCWYFLRYPNPDLQDKAFDKEDMKYWLPVDLYIGGIEHAILHLLYSRFYIKVLYDLGYIAFDEPFTKLFNQGMICMYSEKSGRVEKMSKSKGNVVNPDDIIKEFGSDALRMYILFMGPPEADCEWQMDGIRGTKNFLGRLWTYLTNPGNLLPQTEKAMPETRKRFHRFLKEFQERVETFKTNTAVSAMMEFLNDLTEKKQKLDHEILEQFLSAISIIVPHFASELLEKLLNKQLEKCTWPKFDINLAQVNEVEIAIQVNGKLRGSFKTPKFTSQDLAEEIAARTVSKWLEGKTVIKIIFVQDKLVNFVIK